MNARVVQCLLDVLNSHFFNNRVAITSYEHVRCGDRASVSFCFSAHNGLNINEKSP